MSRSLDLAPSLSHVILSGSEESPYFSSDLQAIVFAKPLTSH